MNYKEVDEGRWAESCREFSLQHESWLVTIRQELNAPEHTAPPQPLAVNQHFWGITDEIRDGRHVISIIMGEEGGHFSHVIAEPKRLLLEETETGEEHGLRIEAADSVTTMEFRAPAYPEVLGEISALDV